MTDADADADERVSASHNTLGTKDEFIAEPRHTREDTTMQAYKTKSGATQYKPSLAELEAITHNDNSGGFCLACGCEASGVEPDARRYTCEACGQPKVYGAEELCLMGLYHS